jgi:hypothetical protein
MEQMSIPPASERQRIIDEFVDRTFAGIPADAPGARIADGMRQLAAGQAVEPTAEQADAWAELAVLVADETFQARARQMAVAGAAAGEQPQQYDPQPVLEHAGAALAAGVAPEAPEAGAYLDRIIPPDTPAEERTRLAEQIELFTDRRVERYWQLLGVLNDQPPFPSGVPAFEWFIAALRAR